MGGKIWNWQQPDSPRFRYDPAALEPLEAIFLRKSGEFSGTIRHVRTNDREEFTVEIISEEALSTSEIEGEVLNRESVPSFLRRNFGLSSDNRRVPRAEESISRLMTELYRQFDAPLSEELLFGWHRLLMNRRADLKDIGCYRTDPTPMQVVSGPLHAPRIHFEAPPFAAVPSEMAGFIDWFNRTRNTGTDFLPILTRAGIAHLYFVSIHPFEDGNGRIGRALAEKSVFEGLGYPGLFSLSHAVNAKRREYYAMLEQSNKACEITEWLLYFARAIIAAQDQAQGLVDFLIAKTRFHDRLRGALNPRQQKAIATMMRAGPTGFGGGMSAEKYVRITGASRATATRDLQDLVSKDALKKTGTLKSTRYILSLSPGAL